MNPSLEKLQVFEGFHINENCKPLAVCLVGLCMDNRGEYIPYAQYSYAKDLSNMDESNKESFKGNSIDHFCDSFKRIIRENI